jgi:protein-disulfide isomerase
MDAKIGEVMKYLLSTILSLFLIVSAASNAQQPSTQAQQLDQINELLEQNPEVIPSVLNSLQQYISSKKTAEQAQRDHGQWLLDNDDAHPWFGNENGTVPVIVFTDYDCPYCKRLEPHLQKLVEEFPQVKVINVLVPLRQQSVQGGNLNPANFALNVWQNQPEQFAEVHDLLYKKNGLHTGKSLEQIARKTGTRSQLDSPKATPTVIERNYRAFADFQLRGTPAIMVGGQTIPGYIEYSELKQIVQQTLAQ